MLGQYDVRDTPRVPLSVPGGIKPRVPPVAQVSPAVLPSVRRGAGVGVVCQTRSRESLPSRRAAPGGAADRSPDGRPGARGPAPAPRGAARPRGGARGLADVGPGRRTRCLRRPGRRPSVAPPGRRGRRRARRRPRHRRDRHGLGEVPGLPAPGALRDPRRARSAGGARGLRALPRTHQGARPRPARRARVAAPRRTPRRPRRRQLARGARLDPRLRGVRPHQPRHAPPLAAAVAPPVGAAAGLAAVRRGRRVPPLPRRLRGARLPRAAPAAAGVRDVRRAPHLRARLGHRR